MNTLQTKIIVVTGGAGFIGSHLIEELLKDEDMRVVSLDDYSTGKEENHIEGAEYIRGDTNNIEEHISFTPDILYHLGEYARTSANFGDVERLWHSNLDGTHAVIEFCRKRKVKMVYAGSSTKFGKFRFESTKPSAESSDPSSGHLQSPYAWMKAWNADLLQRYGDWFGVSYAIAYFYNAYGEREISAGPHATLIGIFTQQYKSGEPLTMVAPVTQRRDFIYVKDIARGLKLIGEKGNGDGYYLGTGKNYTIREVAEMFGGKIEIAPERAGDRMESSIDLNKIQKLGWEAKMTLEEYIRNIKS